MRWYWLVALAGVGCGKSGEEVSCGPGTELVDGVCQVVGSDTDVAGDDTDVDSDTDDTNVDTGTDTDPGDTDTGTPADDADGDGYTLADGDCDDFDGDVHPGASEVCDNGVDDDCDGTVNGCGWSGESDVATEGIVLKGHRSMEAVNLVRVIDDTTGDGAPDLLVSSPYASENGTNSGLVYVVPGPIVADGNLVDVSAARLTGNAYDVMGYAIRSAGDLDGDGVSELAVAALGPQDSSGYGKRQGAIYVIDGGVSGDHVVEDAGHAWTPESPSDGAGSDLDVADVTGDGVPDLIVGATSSDKGAFFAGAAYVVDGTKALAGGSLGSAKARIYDSTSNAKLGSTVAGLGDVDGDGIGDVAIGATGYYDAAKHVYPGAIYVYFGPMSGAYTESTADATVYGVANSVSLLYYPGTLVGPGDVTGDGYDDMLVGSPGENAGSGGNRGTTYLLSGTSISGTGSLLLSDAVVLGENTQSAGYRLAGLGDLDGDGQVDVAIGAPGDDRYGTGTGEVFVFHGSTLSGNLSTKDADAGFYGDEAGWGVASASGGDITGDGLGDLVTSAPSATGEAAYAGLVFVVPGSGL